MSTNICSCAAVAVVAILLGTAAKVAAQNTAQAAAQSAAQSSLQELANEPPRFLAAARKLLKWDEPAEPAKIAGPIYFVGTRGLSVFLVKTSAGLLVINTGMPGSGRMIEASIRKLGFDPKDIKILLAGHAHCDHTGGHAYLKKISGGQIAMIREEKDLFESGGKLDFHYGRYPEFAFDPAKVDWVFEHEDILKLGDVSLTTLLTPGHTRGSTTFVMQFDEGGKTYTVVFPNGTSVNPGYRVAVNPSYPGIANDYRRTLTTLESLRPDIWLMPHNEAYGYEAKLTRAAKDGTQAWVDPEGYKKWVAVQRQNFEAALEREKKAEK